MEHPGPFDAEARSPTLLRLPPPQRPTPGSPSPCPTPLQIEAASEDLKGKPEQIVDKIVTGRVEKAIKTKLLLQQPYIRDSSMTVDEFVKGYTARLGENIKVARFVRFAVGE